MSLKKLTPALWAALPVFLLDLGSKELVLRGLQLEESRELCSFFNLVLVMNSGAAFSLFAGDGGGQGLKMALLSLFALVPLGVLFYLARKEERLQIASLGLVFGGAWGNILDRLRHGAVVDFLDFHLGDRHWPAFNLADVAVVLGLAFFLLSLVLTRSPRKFSGQAGGKKREGSRKPSR
ncbi:MAG: signal peptidase II [Deltaproteobacteria bacterium]|nr:signal peptidase II [Deltaproteobacteria bacterium]